MREKEITQLADKERAETEAETERGKVSVCERENEKDSERKRKESDFCRVRALCSVCACVGVGVLGPALSVLSQMRKSCRAQQCGGLEMIAVKTKSLRLITARRLQSMRSASAAVRETLKGKRNSRLCMSLCSFFLCPGSRRPRGLSPLSSEEWTFIFGGVFRRPSFLRSWGLSQGQALPAPHWIHPRLFVDFEMSTTFF